MEPEEFDEEKDNQNSLNIKQHSPNAKLCLPQIGEIIHIKEEFTEPLEQDFIQNEVSEKQNTIGSELIKIEILPDLEIKQESNEQLPSKRANSSALDNQDEQAEAIQLELDERMENVSELEHDKEMFLSAGSYPRLSKVKSSMNHNINIENKVFECSNCRKRFSNSSYLRRHRMRVHSVEKPCKCSICKKSFNYPSALSSHMNIHSVKKPFKCIICKKEFTQLGNLQIHNKRVHSVEKLYECSICKKKFNISSDLARHISLHSGEQPFQCVICETKFANLGNLRQHKKRLHTAGKSYECFICEKRFFSSNSIKNHLRIHPCEPNELNKKCTKKSNR